MKINLSSLALRRPNSGHRPELGRRRGRERGADGPRDLGLTPPGYGNLARYAGFPDSLWLDVGDRRC